MCRKQNIAYIEFRTMHDFRHPLGALELSPRDGGGTVYCTSKNMPQRFCLEIKRSFF